MFDPEMQEKTSLCPFSLVVPYLLEYHPRAVIREVWVVGDRIHYS